MTSMNTAIGTMEESAAATPVTPTSQAGSESTTSLNSARLESAPVSPGTTNSAAMPSSIGTNSSTL